MTPEQFSEMERACLATILRRLCKEAELNPEEIFEEAALEVTGNFDCKEAASDLLDKLHLA